MAAISEWAQISGSIAQSLVGFFSPCCCISVILTGAEIFNVI